MIHNISQIFTPVVQQLSIWINPYHALETRISAIATKNLTAENKNDLELAFKLAGGWTWPAKNMQFLLSSLPEVTINAFIDDLLKCEDKDEILEQLPRYLKILSTASLLNISQLKTHELASQVFLSQGLTKDFALKSELKKEAIAIFKEFAVEFKYFCHHLLELLTAVTGINEIGPEPHHKYSDVPQMKSWEAQHKIDAYWKLIACPAAIFAFICTFSANQALAFTLTALFIITALIAIVVYQRYLKPCPMQHSGLKNLSFEVLKNKSTIYPRLDIIREIERAFAEGKGALLVGEPGVGKSSIPIAMAELMEENKICTFIKGAPIFSCGASKLRSGYNDPLDSITDRFYKYRNEVIFFFDEFHALFKENTLRTQTTAEDIKLFCQDFKYLIGATTTEEYKQLVQDQPAIVGRRFKVIFMKPADDSEIKMALSLFLQTAHPEIVLEENALDCLIENAQKYEPNTSKIDAAHSFLNGVINKMTIFDFKELQDRLAGLEDQRKELEQHYQNVQLDRINELNRQLQEKDAEIDQ
ncbi:MAG: AAA family ATPase, partial [Parachlamydiaceae bacterium]